MSPSGNVKSCYLFGLAKKMSPVICLECPAETGSSTLDISSEVRVGVKVV